jgi:hypothetical protein
LFEELPARLRALSLRSMRLQARIAHLDQSLSVSRSYASRGEPSPIASQIERLRTAFAGHDGKIASL